MKPVLRQLCCLLLLTLSILVTNSNAKPDKPVGAPPPIDFSDLDKLVIEELKEKNTPGAVITVVSGDQVVYQKAFKEHAMTKSGERKFTYGAQNENEIVFVPGKSGKIEFLFTVLYGAKKIK
jgi:hypothetical protein